MAGVGGGGGGKRNVNSDVNMIPFIDLLMVTISFLLITAVWVTHSRIEANAQAPGDTKGPPEVTQVEKVMHIHHQTAEFRITWKQGDTVISESHVPRTGKHAHDALAKRIVEEWRQHGGHQSATDPARDRAVLHTANDLPFEQVVATMDAIYAAKREFRTKRGGSAKLPAFAMTFSSR